MNTEIDWAHIVVEELSVAVYLTGELHGKLRRVVWFNEFSARVCQVSARFEYVEESYNQGDDQQDD